MTLSQLLERVKRDHEEAVELSTIEGPQYIEYNKTHHEELLCALEKAIEQRDEYIIANWDGQDTEDQELAEMALRNQEIKSILKGCGD